jgi:hypothetical protein
MKTMIIAQYIRENQYTEQLNDFQGKQILRNTAED